MRIYKTLIGLARGLGRKSLFYRCGSGCAQTGVAAAVSIAGGTTLAIDSDAAAMKSAMRAGYLDFVVNSLDEALRTLKNEIRQKRPLSVGLIADVGHAGGNDRARAFSPICSLPPSGGPDPSYGRNWMRCASIAGFGRAGSARRQVKLEAFTTSASFAQAWAAAALRERRTAVLTARALPADDRCIAAGWTRAPQILPARAPALGGAWLLAAAERENSNSSPTAGP